VSINDELEELHWGIPDPDVVLGVFDGPSIGAGRGWNG
jgi:hypothetical protein